MNTSDNTIKVNTAAVPAATTDIASTQSGNNDAFRSTATPRTKVYNTAGIAYVKGGSQLGSGFFQCVTTSYTNLVNSPVALALIIISSVGLIATHQSNLSPLDISYNALLKTANDSHSPNFARSLASFFAYILSLLLQFQSVVLPSMLFAGVYVAKPSRNNAWLCSILTLITILGDFPQLIIAILGQLTLMFTQIRSPSYKFIIFSIAFLCIIMGFAHVSQLVGLKQLTVVEVPSTTPSPPTTTTPTTTISPPTTTTSAPTTTTTTTTTVSPVTTTSTSSQIPTTTTTIFPPVEVIPETLINTEHHEF